MRRWNIEKLGIVFCLGATIFLAGCGTATAKSNGAAGSAGVAGSAQTPKSQLEETWTQPLAEDKSFSTIQSVHNKKEDVAVHMTQPEEDVTAEWLCHSTDGGKTYTIVGENYNVDKQDMEADADGIWYDSFVDEQGEYPYPIMYQLPDGSSVGSNPVAIDRNIGSAKKDASASK